MTSYIQAFETILRITVIFKTKRRKRDRNFQQTVIANDFMISIGTHF